MDTLILTLSVFNATLVIVLLYLTLKKKLPGTEPFAQAMGDLNRNGFTIVRIGKDEFYWRRSKDN